MNFPTDKACRKCGVGLVVSENWFKSCVEKQNYTCRECFNAHARRRYAADPVKHLKVQRIWRTANPPAIRAKDARRRAREVNALPPWTDLAAIAHLEAARWIFASLHGVDECEVHLDHIIPLKASVYINGTLTQIASGLHVEANLTFKLARDNCSKNCRFDEAELNYQPIYEQDTT
jgi:hypothetical protein